MSTSLISENFPNKDKCDVLAERLEYVRRLLNVTQGDFAGMMGVSLSAYKRYLHGTSPNFDAFVQIYQHPLLKPYCWWILTGDFDNENSKKNSNKLLEQAQQKQKIQQVLTELGSIGWVEIQDCADLDKVSDIIQRALVQ